MGWEISGEQNDQWGRISRVGKKVNDEAKGPREMEPRGLLMTDTQEVGGNLGD